jgi:hypothetical protein
MVGEEVDSALRINLAAIKGSHDIVIGTWKDNEGDRKRLPL